MRYEKFTTDMINRIPKKTYNGYGKCFLIVDKDESIKYGATLTPRHTAYEYWPFKAMYIFNNLGNCFQLEQYLTEQCPKNINEAMQYIRDYRPTRYSQESKDRAIEIGKMVFNGLTYADIGLKFGISRQRVNQIVNNILPCVDIELYKKIKEM